MSERWIRSLLRVALVLALVVVGASSYLRLAGNGLGCEPSPGCYGTPAAFEQAQQTGAVQLLRIAHRVAASAFLILALVLVMLAWRTWNGAQRGAGAGVLAITAVLAVIGRLTPSALPFITWINVLGGFALIGLLLWLLVPARPFRAPNPAASVVLLALLVVQVLGGTLLSSRLAASACDPACVHAPAGNLLALVNPLRAGTAFDVAGNAGGATLLHALHRLGGLALVLAALAWAACAWAPTRRTLVASAALAVLTLGMFLAHQGGPAIGAAHALAAALLLAGLARLLRPRRHGGHSPEAVQS